MIQIFTRLNPALFNVYFEQWRLSLKLPKHNNLAAEQVASPTVSADQVWISSKQLMLHQPALFKQSYHDSQVATWLRQIDIQGSVVLVQGADKEQPETLQTMVLNRQAQYIEAVNENLAQSLSEHFTEGERVQFKHKRHCHKRLKQQHGDVHESRRYSLVEAQDYPEYQRWPGLQSLGRLIIKRSHHHESTEQTLYFLTSLDYQSMDRFIEATKDYGSQTDQPQSILTLHFNQDNKTGSSAYTAKNIANLETLAWKRLKKDKNRHYDINIQRKHAGWNYRYLLSLLRDSD